MEDCSKECEAMKRLVYSQNPLLGLMQLNQSISGDSDLHKGLDGR